MFLPPRKVSSIVLNILGMILLLTVLLGPPMVIVGTMIYFGCNPFWSIIIAMTLGSFWAMIAPTIFD